MTAVEAITPRNDGAYVFHYPRKFLWSETSRPPAVWRDMDVYLHVPFCRKICTFCTFERRVHSRRGMELFVDALQSEISLAAAHDDFSQAKLRSIYMGGGTASLLTNDVIASFLRGIFDLTGSTGGMECTLECEPTNKRRSDYEFLREHGVNRVSVGAQTFDNDTLKKLNRSHNADQTKRTVSEALEAGIPTVHIDLMYGLPDQTPESWRSDLEQAVALGVHHISAYQLIVFDHELLSREMARNDSHLPPPEIIDEMRRMATSVLASPWLQPVFADGIWAKRVAMPVRHRQLVRQRLPRFRIRSLQP